MEYAGAGRPPTEVAPARQTGRLRDEAPVPFKVLLMLGGAVLLAHLALLRGLPLSLDRGDAPEPARAFNTRTVGLPPPRPAAAAPAPKPALKPRPSARPIDPPPSVLAAAEPPATSAPPPAPASPEPEPSSPAATPIAETQAPDPQPAPAATPERVALAAMAYKPPGPVHLKYRVEAKRFPIALSADLYWRQDGHAYDARLEISAFGLSRTQTSRGLVTAEGLAPLRFSDKLRTEVAAHFDREKGRVIFSANTPDAVLQGGAQDRLSVLLQLSTMIAGDPGQYPNATTISFQTIGPRDADTWQFTVGEHERLTLPGGELDTLKLVRNPRREFDQKVEVWLAPTLDYLPVRVLITEPGGDYLDQKLQSSAPPE